MPIGTLYVEGDLDQQLLNPPLEGWPRPIARGSKGDLPFIVRQDLKYGKSVCYLRDRDFDYEPPALSQRNNPTEDRRIDNVVHGYRWVRHSIENYLLDPRIAEVVARVTISEWEQQLTAAATLIRDYQAGRWAIGQVRQALPSKGRLATRPSALRNEIALPMDLSETASWQWVNGEITPLRQEAAALLAEAAVRARFDNYRAQLPITSASDILLWYAGKDLLKALETFLVTKRFPNPLSYCNAVVAWVQAHPDETRNFFPEWRALKTILNA